jgi:Copper amine oxidase N-terminal domain
MIGVMIGVNLFSRRPILGAITMLCSVLLIAAPMVPARADAVQIFINGTQQHYDQAPIERAGRVFVPLRGVFEALGASVVYSNGVINATGRDGTTVQLSIGSHNAVVNGAPVSMDVAPFVIGARTLVPLRFVSQSLGASIDYNNTSRVVTVTSRGGTLPQTSSVELTDLRPGNGEAVMATQPTISGRFSQSVDPNTVKITLDGRDVSSTTDISTADFLFTPPYSLGAQNHQVRVTGRSQTGTAFDRSWSFSSGTSNASNYISSVSPANGSTVGGSFTVSGTTLPNSNVHIAAVSSAVLAGVFRVQTGDYSTDVTADGNGHFSQGITMSSVGGGTLSVRITSTAPVTRASAVVTQNYRT